jgi:TRAP-type transport system periplasmic protein
MHSTRSHRGLARTAVAALAVLSMGALAACSGQSGGDGGGGGDGSPVHIRVATYLGDSIASVQAGKRWTDLVTEYTGGDVTFEWFLSESLLPTAEILGGVGSGTVEMGLFSHGYHPGELPLNHAMNIGFLTSNTQAVAATMQDLYETNDAYKAEWDRNNVRPVMFGLETSTVLGCPTEVTSDADVKGKNVRAAALITEDFSSVGANVVALTAPDMLDAFDRGVIDCWSAVGLALANDIGLAGITPYVYDYGRGGNGAQELIISNAVYDSLSDSQREAMTKASADVFDEYFSTIQAGAAADSCQAIKDGGGTFSFLSDSAQADWSDVAGPANEKRFLEIAGADGQAFLDDYKAKLAENEKTYADYVDPDATCAAMFS